MTQLTFPFMKKKRRSRNVPRSFLKFVYKNLSVVTCGICGQRVSKKKASVDHIIPLSKGGVDARCNLQIAHLTCNRLKGNNI